MEWRMKKGIAKRSLFINEQDRVQFYSTDIKNNACIELTNTGIINLNLNYEERIKEANSLKS